jgi:hypothetical protein
MMGREYKVGRGRPPRGSQFKKGQSGNPKGRPKGSRNVSTILTRFLDESRTLPDGKRQTFRELVLLKQVMKAAEGSLPHAIWVFSYDEGQAAGADSQVVIELDMGQPAFLPKATPEQFE